MNNKELEKLISSSLSSNTSLSMDDRNCISEIILNYFSTFRAYNISVEDTTYLNLGSVLKTLNLSENTEINTAYEYNEETNSLICNKNRITVTNKILDKSFQASILKAICTPITKTNDNISGLIFKKDNIEYGKLINDKCIERVRELTFGNQDDEIVTVPTTEDYIVRDLERFLGYESLFNNMINAKGLDFYYIMSDKISPEFSNSLYTLFNKYIEFDKNNIHVLNEIDLTYNILKSKIEEELLNKDVKTM